MLYLLLSWVYSMYGRCIVLLAVATLFLLTYMVSAAPVVDVVTINVLEDGRPVRAYLEIYDGNKTLVYNGSVDGRLLLYNVSEGDYTVYVYREGRSYVFRVYVSNTSNSFNLELKTTTWLQSNWQLLAIGVGAGIAFVLLVSLIRR